MTPTPLALEIGPCDFTNRGKIFVTPGQRDADRGNFCITSFSNLNSSNEIKNDLKILLLIKNSVLYWWPSFVHCRRSF
jgi:hypothetical protein